VHLVTDWTNRDERLARHPRSSAVIGDDYHCEAQLLRRLQLTPVRCRLPAAPGSRHPRGLLSRLPGFHSSRSGAWQAESAGWKQWRYGQPAVAPSAGREAPSSPCARRLPCWSTTRPPRLPPPPPCSRHARDADARHLYVDGRRSGPYGYRAGDPAAYSADDGACAATGMQPWRYATRSPSCSGSSARGG
jgi:hypothetical protein